MCGWVEVRRQPSDCTAHIHMRPRPLTYQGHGLGDHEVGEPVGQRGERHALAPEPLRKDFGGHHPPQRLWWRMVIVVV